MKLNICGNPFGTSGYAAHTRGLAKGLIELGEDVALESFAFPGNNWKLMCPEVLHTPMERNYSKENNVIINLPEYAQIKSGDRCKSIHQYAVFEGTKIPKYWVETLNQPYITSVLVPSEHNKIAVQAAGVNKPIHVIPHGYDPEVFHPKETTRDNDTFRFLFVGGWKDGERDRKGLDVLMRAFAEEFKPDEKVDLIVKINGAYGDLRQIEYNLHALNLPPKEQRRNIQVTFFKDDQQEYTDKDIAELYHISDCFVMPSKGEAFGLPVLEAMACGIPAIVTGYGGQLDFVNHENGYIINVESMEPATGEFFLYEQAQWAKPNKEHLRRLLRHAFEHQDEVKQKGKKALETAQNYTWKKSAEKLLKLIKNV